MYVPGLVSIVIPCYNSTRYLAETLASVRAQTYSNWELIAVDDASTDNTAALLDAAADAEPRIRVVRRECNGGRPSVTKNTGIAHCRGEFVAFLDHDDRMLPTRLQHLVSLLNGQQDLVAAFANAAYIDESGQRTGVFLTRFLADANQHLDSLPGTSDVYRSRPDFWIFQLIRYGAMLTATVVLAPHRMPALRLGFDESLMLCEETELWVRVGKTGPIGYLDQIVGEYRIHRNNASGNQLNVHADLVRLLTLHRQRYRPHLDSRQRRLLTARLADARANLAWSLRRDGQHTQSAIEYCRALAEAPNFKYLPQLLKAWLPVRS